MLAAGSATARGSPWLPGCAPGRKAPWRHYTARSPAPPGPGAVGTRISVACSGVVPGEAVESENGAALVVGGARAIGRASDRFGPAAGLGGPGFDVSCTSRSADGEAGRLWVDPFAPGGAGLRALDDLPPLDAVVWSQAPTGPTQSTAPTVTPARAPRAPPCARAACWRSADGPLPPARTDASGESSPPTPCSPVHASLIGSGGDVLAVRPASGSEPVEASWHALDR